jgi:predicted GNAT family N-acyltransferase
MRLVRGSWTSGANGSNRFDRPGEVLFRRRRDERLVGVCGLQRRPVRRDDDRIGRVRPPHTCSPTARRHGVARALMAETLAAVPRPLLHC